FNYLILGLYLFQAIKNPVVLNLRRRDYRAPQYGEHQRKAVALIKTLSRVESFRQSEKNHSFFLFA
uniref:hypothetical protein n=1 Tax=Hafnia alvei TaxID=569 RepID=UPI0026F297CD